MNYTSPVQIPSSFDPAVHLHSETQLDLEPSYSDDTEAFRLQAEEITAAKTREGIVIQHRAWKVPEVFRSEDDRLVDTPTKRSTTALDALLPSSPPASIMPSMSSPVTYPPSSSPAEVAPRKKRKLGCQRSPLRDVGPNQANRIVGGFLADDSDEDDSMHSKIAPIQRFPTGGSVVECGRTDEPMKDFSQTSVDAVASRGNLIGTRLPTPPRIDPDRIPDFGYFSAGSQVADKPPVAITTCSGKTFSIRRKSASPHVTYEQLIASRSTAAPGRARKSYYGIDIHQLMDDAALEAREAAELVENRQARAREQTQQPNADAPLARSSKTLMWTEKYRARKFTDLVGDERTHRSVLHWFKSWDPIVFPGSARLKPKRFRHGNTDDEERSHRKVLLLAGPPGLGKTTLAHVCARQAGYEVQEINASDERSRDVVTSRVKDMVGTENVKGINAMTNGGTTRKAGRPVCVVLDEVDGAVSGSGGGGEGGFVKALVDLVLLDQRNSNAQLGATSGEAFGKKKRKGDKFRMLRPLVLICNDVYHPALRPLRQSSLAEIIHIRKPALDMVVSRVQNVFRKEGVDCDADGVRRLCEATWGVSNRKEGGSGSGTGEGDIRGIMVVGELVAGRLRATNPAGAEQARLTRRWVEEHLLDELASGGGAARSLGRGGTREVVERLFVEGAGFPKTAPVSASRHDPASGAAVGVAEANKKRAMDRLREMVGMCGDSDRIVTDSFSTYPTQPFQDDTFLSKPSAAYEWLFFHDYISSAVHHSQEWELASYLSTTPLAFHHLFASSARAGYSSSRTSKPQSTLSGRADSSDAEEHPFLTIGAPFAAAEQLKSNRAALEALRGTLSLPLARAFRSDASLAVDLLPPLMRMLNPDVHPVVINSGTGTGGNKHASSAVVRKASETALVARAVNAMVATGVRFERARVEDGAAAGGAAGGGWIYRMEPALDFLARFETARKGGAGADEKVRFAVRQVLDVEVKREVVRRTNLERQRRGGVNVDGRGNESQGRQAGETMVTKAAEETEKKIGVKRDFFGRVVAPSPAAAAIAMAFPGAAQQRNSSGSVSKRQKLNGCDSGSEGRRVWVSFHEGFSNAVRKPITLEELMRGM